MRNGLGTEMYRPRLGGFILRCQKMPSAKVPGRGSCVPAAGFSDLISYVVELGGDTDTIGAMAGGIFGAHRGRAALPAELLDRLEDAESIARLAAGIAEIAG